jgi:hypothetical protein
MAKGVKTFSGRTEQHTRAVTAVKEVLDKLDIECFDQGIEEASQAARDALMKQYDATSLMIRYKPDLIGVRLGGFSVLVEVKSEGQGSCNFAVEVDSFTATKAYAAMGHSVVYAFTTLTPESSQSIVGCWTSDVVTPKLILVPRRPTSQHYLGGIATMRRLEKVYPQTKFQMIRWSRRSKGSGTPFFLIPKDTSYLKPFYGFIKVEALKLAKGSQ